MYRPRAFVPFLIRLYFLFFEMGVARRPKTVVALPTGRHIGLARQTPEGARRPVVGPGAYPSAETGVGVPAEGTTGDTTAIPRPVAARGLVLAGKAPETEVLAGQVVATAASHVRPANATGDDTVVRVRRDQADGRPTPVRPARHPTVGAKEVPDEVVVAPVMEVVQVDLAGHGAVTRPDGLAVAGVHATRVVGVGLGPVLAPRAGQAIGPEAGLVRQGLVVVVVTVEGPATPPVGLDPPRLVLVETDTRLPPAGLILTTGDAAIVAFLLVVGEVPVTATRPSETAPGQDRQVAPGHLGGLEVVGRAVPEVAVETTGRPFEVGVTVVEEPGQVEGVEPPAVEGKVVHNRVPLAAGLVAVVVDGHT